MGRDKDIDFIDDKDIGGGTLGVTLTEGEKNIRRGCKYGCGEG